MNKTSRVFNGRLYPNREQHIKLMNTIKNNPAKEQTLTVCSRRRSYRSHIQTLTMNNNFMFLPDKTIQIDGIGIIKTSLPVKFDDYQNITDIVMTNKNKEWHLQVQCHNLKKIEDNSKKDNERWIGIDFGICNLITLSNGLTYEFNKDIKNKIRCLKDYRNKYLKKNSKRLDNRQVYQSIARYQADLDHLINNYVNNVCYGLITTYNHIAIENLSQVNSMRSQHNFNHYIYQYAWTSFQKTLKNLSEKYDIHIYEVNPEKTSQLCSRCGRYVKKTNRQRRHFCTNCLLDLDRDQNAAINILNRAKSNRVNEFAMAA